MNYYLLQMYFLFKTLNDRINITHIILFKTEVIFHLLILPNLYTIYLNKITHTFILSLFEISTKIWFNKETT